jgi:hypothetical protein
MRIYLHVEQEAAARTRGADWITGAGWSCGAAWKTTCGAAGIAVVIGTAILVGAAVIGFAHFHQNSPFQYHSGPGRGGMVSQGQLLQPPPRGQEGPHGQDGVTASGTGIRDSEMAMSALALSCSGDTLNSSYTMKRNGSRFLKPPWSVMVKLSFWRSMPLTTSNSARKAPVGNCTFSPVRWSMNDWSPSR